MSRHRALSRGTWSDLGAFSHSPFSTLLTIFRIGMIPFASRSLMGHGMIALSSASSTASVESGSANGSIGGVSGGRSSRIGGEGERISGLGEGCTLPETETGVIGRWGGACSDNGVGSESEILMGEVLNCGVVTLGRMDS